MEKKIKEKTPCEERKLMQSVSSKERIKRYEEIIMQYTDPKNLIFSINIAESCRRGFEALFYRRYTWSN